MSGGGASSHEIKDEEDIVSVADGIGEENVVASPGPEISEMRVKVEHEAINGAN